MTYYALTDTSGARHAARLAPAYGAARRLRLLPSGDGWSLVRADGALVFSALGCSGRRLCLEFARATGVLALASH
jgi:hypothetical protein